jgi:hypothetical protein
MPARMTRRRALCRTCVARFPHFGRAHAELAEIYSQWFRTDLCSSDCDRRHSATYRNAIAADLCRHATRTSRFAVLSCRIGAAVDSARAAQAGRGLTTACMPSQPRFSTSSLAWPRTPRRSRSRLCWSRSKSAVS